MKRQENLSEFVLSRNLFLFKKYLLSSSCHFYLLEEIVGEYSQGNISEAKLLIFSKIPFLYYEGIPEKFIIGEICNAYELRRKEIGI